MVQDLQIKHITGQRSMVCCSVAKSYLTLCDPTDCSTPGFPVLHQLLEFAQTHVHLVSPHAPRQQKLENATDYITM